MKNTLVKSFIISTIIYGVFLVILFKNSCYSELTYNGKSQIISIKLESKNLNDVNSTINFNEINNHLEKHVNDVANKFSGTSSNSTTSEVAQIFKPLFIALNQNKNQFYPKDVFGNKVSGRVIINISFDEIGGVESISIVEKNHNVNVNMAALNLVKNVLEKNYNNQFPHNLAAAVEIRVPINYQFK